MAVEANLPSLLLGDRVAFAFAVDVSLFAVLQGYVFAERPGSWWRYVPFLGLAAWLLLPDEITGEAASCPVHGSQLLQLKEERREVPLQLDQRYFHLHIPKTADEVVTSFLRYSKSLSEICRKDLIEGPCRDCWLHHSEDPKYLCQGEKVIAALRSPRAHIISLFQECKAQPHRTWELGAWLQHWALKARRGELAPVRDRTSTVADHGPYKDRRIAARATWHMKFDILDTKKQVVLCSSSVSVLEVLNEICASEGGDPISNLTIRERLEDSAWSTWASRWLEIRDEERCQVVRRKLIMKQLDKPFQKATEMFFPLRSRSRKGHGEQGEMEATKPRASQAVQALAAFVSGSKDGPERQDLGTDGMELFVSFQVVSRWRGYGRSRCPPSRYMEGPSPIRCLATLSSSVVAGYEDGMLSPAPLHQFQAHRVPVSAMAVVPPLNCVITAGEARNGLEGFSESLLRLWSSVSLELRQSVSLHGQVARCLLPLALGAQVDEIMQQAQAAGKSLEKREKAVPPCLAVGTDSRQLKQVRLLRLTLD
eukprot:g13340.t1